MLIFGSVFSPIGMLLWMKEHNIKFCLNSPRILCRNIVFSSVHNLSLKRNKIGNRRVIVFDALEKLETIENIQIISKEEEEYLKNFLLNNKDTGPKESLKINRINYIQNTIETNKQAGLLHKYNTILYSITAKQLREEMKQIVLNYVSGEMTKEQLDEHMDNLIRVRRSRTKEVVEEIHTILKSDEFSRIRQAVMALLKHSFLVDRPMVERVSSSHKVEPYDVHYLYSVISKNNKKPK